MSPPGADGDGVRWCPVRKALPPHAPSTPESLAAHVRAAPHEQLSEIPGQAPERARGKGPDPGFLAGHARVLASSPGNSHNDALASIRNR
jgi:hypothetical protein